jgi:hypothetical protein
MHSKAKLALAILTSPNAAFEEILERKLLGTAIFIVALTGCVSMALPVMYAPHGGPTQYFLLGKNNSITWLGLCMLYAFILSKLLTWIGSEIDYPRVLTIMGWSQILLLLMQIITAVGTAVAVSGRSSQILLQFMYAVNLGLPIWYVALIGVGIRAATGAQLSRGVLTYVVIAIAAGIAFTITYQSAMSSAFQKSLPGVKTTAEAIVASDTGPWLVAGVIGLLIGMVQLGRGLGWDRGLVLRSAASAFVVGAAAV